MPLARASPRRPEFNQKPASQTGPPPQQIIHQQRAAKSGRWYPAYRRSAYSGEQPQRQVELTLAQGAVDLPQLVQRVMFAGGRAAAVCPARSSCSLASARQARKSASASSGEWNSESFPDRWEQSGARSPAAAAAAGDEGPRAAAAGGGAQLRWPAATSARQSASC